LSAAWHFSREREANGPTLLFRWITVCLRFKRSVVRDLSAAK
jgi:hypothetical protein